MARVFGFSFGSPRTTLAFATTLVVLALIWQTLIERSIRRHPDGAWQTVREHCRYRMGQDLRNQSAETVAARMAGCERFQVRTIEASGGLMRPVMLKVTLDASPVFPLPVRELVFRSLHANLAFSDSLHGLATGRWAFNPLQHLQQPDLPAHTLSTASPQARSGAAWSGAQSQQKAQRNRAPVRR
jgi:hypothetical protein